MLPSPLPLLLLLLLLVPALATAGNEPMPLFLVNDTYVNAGAVCLDGTAPGFYFSTAQTSAASNKWILYFKGGGWCYNEADCALRAKTELGSSKHFPSTFAFSGPMDSEPALNPGFADFNRVVLFYCDGASFSGDRLEPYVMKGTNQKLYFRGARVLRALLDTLVADHGLGAAETVLLSGGSAGGLSTFLHADRVHDYLKAVSPKLQTFKAAPVSGFFLLHRNAAGANLYPDEMKYVFTMQNASGGVNQACIASFMASPAEQWRCIFANYSYAHTQTPMFPLQSSLDAWQMGNIWQGDKACLAGGFKVCGAAAIQDLNGYSHDLVRDLQRANGKAARPGEGGFVESCLEHVGAQASSNFNRYAIDNTTMQQALHRWFFDNGDGESSSSNNNNNNNQHSHWYLPCDLSPTAPHQCNPTC